MQMCVCSLGFVVLFWGKLHNSIQYVVGRLTVKQLDGMTYPRMTQQQSTPNYIQRANIYGI